MSDEKELETQSLFARIVGIPRAAFSITKNYGTEIGTTVSGTVFMASLAGKLSPIKAVLHSSGQLILRHKIKGYLAKTIGATARVFALVSSTKVLVGTGLLIIVGVYWWHKKKNARQNLTSK